MIEESDYRFPHKKESKHEPTEDEKLLAEKTLAYLESLPWRPFGVEW